MAQKALDAKLEEERKKGENLEKEKLDLTGQNIEHENEIRQLREQIRNFSSERDRSDEEIRNLSSECKRLEDRTRKLEQEISAQREEAISKIQALRSQIGSLEAERDRLRRENRQLQDEISVRVSSKKGRRRSAGNSGEKWNPLLRSHNVTIDAVSEYMDCMGHDVSTMGKSDAKEKMIRVLTDEELERFVGQCYTLPELQERARRFRIPVASSKAKQIENFLQE